MEPSTKTAEKSILLKVAKKLTAAQQELDELAVQLTLGKAEATDRFEEIKKEFSARLNELKLILGTSPQKEVSPDLRSKVEALELQLASGRAGTKDLFETQKNKILSAITGVETAMKATLQNHPSLYELVNELEKFKLKLEILRLRFVVKKFEIKDGFRSGMKEARKEIDNIITGAKSKIGNAKEAYTGFREEITDAYKHMRKAVKKM